MQIFNNQLADADVNKNKQTNKRTIGRMNNTNMHTTTNDHHLDETQMHLVHIKHGLDKSAIGYTSDSVTVIAVLIEVSSKWNEAEWRPSSTRKENALKTK